MKKNWLPILAFCALILLSWGCGGDSGTGNNPTGPSLSIFSVSPATLSRGATSVPFTINGNGFTGNVLVDLGPGINVMSRDVVSANTIELLVDVIPSASPGPRAVVVSAGSNSTRLEGGVTISENRAPAAAFLANPTQGTLQTIFEFDAGISSDPDGRITSYRWQITDGSSPSGMKLKKQFSEKGTYKVRLTVTDDQGGISTGERTVEVGENTPPLPSFKMNPGSGNQFTQFTFDASESVDPDGEIRSYQWDLGGFATNGKKVTHRFNKEGDYNIILQVKDSSGASAFARKSLKVTFFDRDQARKQISKVIVDFLKLFADIERLSAEEIVRGFSRSPECSGRAREISIINSEKGNVRRSDVEFLGEVQVTYLDPQKANANITNRFFGEDADGFPYSSVSTHFFTMVNEPDGWKMCNFYLVKK